MALHCTMCSWPPSRVYSAKPPQPHDHNRTGSQDIAQQRAMHTDTDTGHSFQTFACYAPANSTVKAVWQQNEILPAWRGVGMVGTIPNSNWILLLLPGATSSEWRHLFVCVCICNMPSLLSSDCSFEYVFAFCLFSELIRVYILLWVFIFISNVFVFMLCL